MTDHTSAWEQWEELYRRRNTDPIQIMAEHLRANGYIVERPESIALPVAVARTGSFKHEDGYRLELQVRVRIGERITSCGHAIDVRHSDMPVQAFSGALSRKFERMIMKELEPQIHIGCERELDKARKEVQ